MRIRRAESPERNSSCLPFSYFFRNHNNKSVINFKAFSNEVRYADQGQFERFNQFMTEYTESDLDSDENEFDDDVTLRGESDKPMFTEFISTTRLQELRKYMKKYNIGVYIIPSEDEHQSEYTSTKDQRRQYISGFTGSAGIAVVTLNNAGNLSGEAALSTDGRYYLQAEQELDKNWTLLKQTVPSYPTWQQWCINKAKENSFSKKISIDPKLITFKNAQWLSQQSEINGLEFDPLFDNLIDLMWDVNGERPTYNNSQIYELDLQYSGVHPNDKIGKIRSFLKEDKSDSLVVAALDDIAWLLNLRGDDVSFNPVFFAYVIVLMDQVWFYIDDSKVDSKTHAYLSGINGLSVKPYKKFWEELSILEAPVVPIEPTLALMNKVKPVKFSSLIADMKTIKNRTEIKGAKNAQFKDGIALARFFAWLEYHLVVKGEMIDEWQAAEKNEYYRTLLPDYKSLSFETISSSGANGAIIHYSPTAEKSDIIDPTKIYLCDSGAQYLDGTTDITRTLHFTKPSKEQILNYTLVLKGHLSLTMEVFLEGTTGSQLDILCRTPLWKHGLNYNHGTGHGIGSFLCVHEGPLYIGKNIEIKPNSFISDEPGYYKDGEYGLRLESDILCVESDKPKFNEKGFMKFEYLTKVPFCQRLIDVSLLTKEEIQWVNDYNYQLREELIPVLDKQFNDVRAIRWLLRETQPL